MIIRATNISSYFEKEKSDQKAHFLQLKNHLSTHAPGFQFIGAYKIFKRTRGIHGWDGKVSLFTNGEVLTGLLPKSVELMRKKTKIKIVDDRSIDSIQFGTTSVDLRDYQEETIKKVFQNKFLGMWWPRGIVQIATGGGKTEVAAAMIQMVEKPTLFTVHRKDLLHQTRERFQGLGIDTGIIGDGVYEDDYPVTVSTVQSLMSKKKGMGTFLEGIEQVFFDEAHHLASAVQKGNIFVEMSRMLPNAYMRWGLTATPFKKDKYSDLLLEGATGQVLFEEGSKSLIDKGYLSAPEIEMVLISKDDSIRNEWPDCYDTGIVFNKERNQKIVERATKADRPCLILISKLDHGRNLKKIFDSNGLNVPFISGEDDTEVRRQAIDNLKSGEADAVIATTIFDEGIDIPEIRTLIIGSGGKSQIKVLQRLGRGMRLAEGKDKVKVIDFMDYTSNLLRVHSRARKMIWEREGFEVKIVS